MLLSVLSYSQDNQIKKDSTKTDIKKNEVKINLAYIIWGYAEISYERLFPKPNISVGTSIGKSFLANTDLDYSVLPYLRMYFGKKEGAGFFLEANAVYFTEDAFRLELDPSTNVTFAFKEGNEKAFGVGLAVGAKFFRKKGWHGEIVAGVGRILNDYKDLYNTEFDAEYPRLGVSIGKRF